MGSFEARGKAMEPQVPQHSFLRVEHRGSRVTVRILQAQPSQAVTAPRLSSLACNCKEQRQTRRHKGRATQAAPTAETTDRIPTITTSKTSRARTAQFDPLLVKTNPYERSLASRCIHRMTSTAATQEDLLVSLEALIMIMIIMIPP